METGCFALCVLKIRPTRLFGVSSERERSLRFCSMPASSTRLILGSDLEYHQQLDGLMPEKKTQ